MNSSVETTKRGPARSKSQGKISVVPLIILAVLVAAGLFFRARQAANSGGGKTDSKAPRDNTPTVKVVPVTRGSLVETLEVTGSLKANQDINLGSKISGRVDKVFVKEGQRIKRGQLLMALDEEDLRQQVNAARAGLQAAQVKLQQTQVGLPARIAQVGTSIDTARTVLETARARYRQALLNEPSKITQAQSQVDTSKAAVESAQARVKQARDTAKQTTEQTEAGIKSAQAGVAQARASLDEVKRGARDQQIAQAQAQVNLAQAQQHDAETELNRQKQLFEGGATAKANVDKAETTNEVAKAQLENARQNLSLVKEGATTEQTRQAEELVRQREAALLQAQAARGQVLTAQSEITTALAALTQAQEGLRQALSNLSQIPITRQETRVAREAVGEAESGLRQALANRTEIPVAQADIPAARAAVAGAQAQLEQAQLNLGYARIYSPINGVVNSKFTDSGQAASPGVTLMNLVSLDDVYFEAQIPESQLSRIEVGQPANVFATSVSNQSINGYVSDIIPVADVRLRQFRLRVSLPGASKLTPGAFARGTIRTQVISNALTVPDEVIHQEDGKQILFVVKDTPKGHEAAHIPITTGAEANGRTQIMGGVEDGAQVITGNTILDDGAKVKLEGEKSKDEGDKPKEKG